MSHCPFSVFDLGFLTLLLVDTEHNNDLVASNTDELLDGTDTSPRKFGKQDHSVDVVVLEQLHVCAHFGDLQSNATTIRIFLSHSSLFRPYLLHVDHDIAVHLRILLLVETAIC